MAKLVNATTGETVLEHLEIADTFWQRFKGLQLRRFLMPNSGILISPCSSLHTCFMRFPIDVIMLDQSNAVIAIRRNVRPWRLLFCNSQTMRIIETNVSALTIALGTRLQIDSA